MDLLRWAPFGELDSFERRMRRLFDLGFVPTAMPVADVYEAEGEFCVELEVPGFDQQDLHVETADHTLRVMGERETSKAEKEKTFALHERLEASFERCFALPPEVDASRIAASFEHGVPKIHAPKVGVPEARTVPIGTSS